jgi:hypothetical protein
VIGFVAVPDKSLSTTTQLLCQGFFLRSIKEFFKNPGQLQTLLH